MGKTASKGDTQQPLRDDVRLLGGLLGDTLKTLASDDVFEMVERVRALSKAAREGDSDSFHRLGEALAGLAVDDAVPVARAFAHFLTLANIAEQHHRIRRRRHYQRDPSSLPQRASFDEAFARLLKSGTSKQALVDALARQRVELVFTAHPTEVVRRTLRQKQRRIADLLAHRDRTDLTIREREESRENLRREVAASWTTDEVRHTRPTPLDEVKWGLVVFEQTLWDALPRFLRTLDASLHAATGQPLPAGSSPIRFASWMGGDRDGNPNVKPRTTEKACLLARWMAVHLYLKEFRALREELSMRDASEELRTRVGDGAEPYRVLLKRVVERLTHTLVCIESMLDDKVVDEDGRGRMYWDVKDIAEPLALCARSLLETGADVLTKGRLLDLQRRIDCFGLTLVRLDLRQEASLHTSTLTTMTQEAGLGAYSTWDESERVDFLCQALREGGRNLNGPPDDVFGAFRVAAQQPAGSLGAYVISMAAAPSDVLAVYVLQTVAGVRPRMRVVPLFETVDDLRNAADGLERLFALPEYRELIQGAQEVMIGYSDSAKDGGRLAAAWELYAAQERIVEVCRANEVHLTLFHGRGGSVGRGGGPIALAIQSQPPGSVNGSLRVTEQGEVIDSKFGLPEIALRTMEVYTTAVLTATLTPSPPPQATWRATMQRLADTSRAAYRTLVYDTPEFVDYFRAATPEIELGELKIGSRPARRTPGTGVTSLRAIPWVFAWTQTRLMLPSWLGVGEALADEIEKNASAVRSMYRDWPFFRSTIDLIEMVLAKASPDIAARYDELLVAEPLRRLGEDLRKRLAQSRESVLQVVEESELLAGNRVLADSINVRNPYVDPINLIQAELLRRLRGDGADERLVHALLVTINGVAAGMRNTG